MSQKYATRRKFGDRVYYHVDHEPTKEKAQARCRAMRKRGYLARYTKSGNFGYNIWRTS